LVLRNGRNEEAPMRWKAWIVASIAALLSVYSLGLVYEGFVGDSYAGVLTFPLIDKAAAQRAYARLPTDAPAAERQAAALRLIQADPTNPQSWTAVAYADWTKNGRLSSTGVEALDHSYAFSFFDRRNAIWRVGFALENWGDLPPELRQDVITEARVALNDPVLAPELAKRLSAVRDPAGRLAAAMISAPN
jgi:hypothetical protein